MSRPFPGFFFAFVMKKVTVKANKSIDSTEFTTGKQSSRQSQFDLSADGLLVSKLGKGKKGILPASYSLPLFDLFAFLSAMSLKFSIVVESI